MVEAVDVALVGLALGEGGLAGVHAVPHAVAPRARAAPAQGPAVHLAGVVEP